MSKYLKFIPIVFSPYLIVLGLFILYKGYFMDTVFHGNPLYLLLTIFILYLTVLLYAVVILIVSLLKRRKAIEILRINMIIKMIHIPAYLFIFILGLICSMTIFTFAVTIIFIILDCISIASSGLIGLGGIVRSLRESKISTEVAFIHGILQFVFCVDIISSISIYRKVKKQIDEGVNEFIIYS